MRLSYIVTVAFLLLLMPPVGADQSGFSTGPLITGYGPVTKVEGAEPLPENIEFNVAFDVTKRATEGTLNRHFESAARFLNMHAAAGVAPENIHVAIVIHGPAVFDATQHGSDGEANQNADLIRTLQAYGVGFYVCGQSAAYQNVKTEDLLPGVKVSISAMTAHAMLQKQGYTLNPF